MRIIVGAIGLILAMAAAAAAAPAPAPSADAGVEDYRIMGRLFRIPKAYLADVERFFPSRTLNKSGEAVVLEALLPDFRPVPKRGSEWDRRVNVADTVDVVIWPRPVGAGPDPYYFEPATHAGCTGPQNGYLICPHKYSLFANHEVLVSIHPERPWAFECAKTGTYQNGQCRVIINLFDDIEISVLFSRVHFDSAEKIIENVYNLICLFLVDQVDLESTINHCE